jgi:elongation factor P
MKTAQELRVGNVVMVGKDAVVVQRAEYSKSGRNASVVKLKFKNLQLTSCFNIRTSVFIFNPI